MSGEVLKTRLAYSIAGIILAYSIARILSA